jgi:hypothetical protein
MLADAYNWLYLGEREIDHRCQPRLDRAFCRDHELIAALGAALVDRFQTELAAALVDWRTLVLLSHEAGKLSFT